MDSLQKRVSIPKTKNVQSLQCMHSTEKHEGFKHCVHILKHLQLFDCYHQLLSLLLCRFVYIFLVDFLIVLALHNYLPNSSLQNFIHKYQGIEYVVQPLYHSNYMNC